MKPTLTPDRSNETVLVMLVLLGAVLSVIGWLRFVR